MCCTLDQSQSFMYKCVVHWTNHSHSCISVLCMSSMRTSFCCDDTEYFKAHVTTLSANCCLSPVFRYVLRPLISSRRLTESTGFGKGICGTIQGTTLVSKLVIHNTTRSNTVYLLTAIIYLFLHS